MRPAGNFRLQKVYWLKDSFVRFRFGRFSSRDQGVWVSIEKVREGGDGTRGFGDVLHRRSQIAPQGGLGGNGILSGVQSIVKMRERFFRVTDCFARIADRFGCVDEQALGLIGEGVNSGAEFIEGGAEGDHSVGEIVGSD